MAFDATYLSARALAESVPYRVEQAEALLRPSASLGTSASRVELNPPIFQSYGSNTLRADVERAPAAVQPRERGDRRARPRNRSTSRAPTSTPPSRS